MEENNEAKTGVFSRLMDRIPERAIGLRTAAIFETVLFLLIVTSLNYIFSDGSRYIGFSPHPFWIIILLISAQYGTSEALLAAMCSSVILLAWNLPEQAMDESTFDYIFQISFRPLMWIITAVVLGEMRVRQININQQLQSDLSETQKRETAITRAYEQLRSVKEGLETRIAGHLQGTVSMYQSLKSIEGLSPVQILMGVSEMLGNVIHPEKFSVFSFGPNGFEVISSQGWTEEDAYSRRLTAESPLYQELLNHQRIICGINKSDAEILGEEGILAGPLINPLDGQIFGMLKIEYLDFIDLTATNVETFKSLCEWSGSAYAQARQFQETLADTMHNLDTGTLSKQFCQFAQQILRYMKVEQGVESKMITITLTHTPKLRVRQRIEAARLLYQSIKEHLPANAMICDGRRLNTQFVILLPGTNDEKLKATLTDLDSWKNTKAETEFQSTQIEFETSAVI